MQPELRRRTTIGLLLGATLLGVLLYLSGLASTMQLGDAGARGFLLVPALPTPLYVAMLLVILAGVGLTLLASIVQRRRKPQAPPSPREEAPKPLWQSALSTLAWLALMVWGLRWLIQHGAEVQAFLERLRTEIGAMQATLGSGTRPVVDQVSSPVAGYTLFVAVIAIYGSIGLIALWVLLEDRGYARDSSPAQDPQVRRVRQAMTAGLRELRTHTEPRQAIIACYARMEHLLEDHGVPAWRHLTPQEYMGVALRGLDLPLDACAGLIQLFELARYSIHPLDDTARTTAIAHLERLTAHLQGKVVHGPAR
jgi:uncharacterized protein DUF4129